MGSRIGGLTAGALLAKRGVKTLVVEQHDLRGDACTTMRSEGITFDEVVVPPTKMPLRETVKNFVRNPLGMMQIVPSLVLYLGVDAEAVPEGTPPILMVVEDLYNITGKGLHRWVCGHVSRTKGWDRWIPAQNGLKVAVADGRRAAMGIDRLLNKESIAKR